MPCSPKTPAKETESDNQRSAKGTQRVAAKVHDRFLPFMGLPAIHGHVAAMLLARNVVIRLLFNIEPHALCERKLRPEIDRVGGATHIGLPCVGAGLATTARLFFATKSTPDLGS